MNPEMRNRLRMIAKGQIGQGHRVTRVTDPFPALHQETDSAGMANIDQAAVTRATREHPVFLPGSNTDERPASRVTDSLEGDWLHPDNVDELEERAAIAQSEAGFPAEFALAFAQLQMNAPPGVDEVHWRRAVDAVGCVLDQCREHVGKKSRI